MEGKKIANNFSIEKQVYSVTKKIIKDTYNDKLGVFENAYGKFKRIIDRWGQIEPERLYLLYYKSYSRLVLKYPDKGDKSALFSLPLTIYSIFWDISKLKGKKSKNQIIEISKDRIKEFSIQPSLEPKIVDLCVAALESFPKKEKKEVAEIKEKEEIAKEKAFARIWTTRTSDPKIGDTISKEEYETIWDRREEIPLLIIKSGGIIYIYIYGKKESLSPRRLGLLEYFLRNRGQGGDIINLLEKVWGEKETAEMLRRELRKGKKEEKVDSDLIREETSHITGTITKLNKFLLDILEVEIKSDRKGQFGFNNIFEYYLIEVI